MASDKESHIQPFINSPNEPLTTTETTTIPHRPKRVAGLDPSLIISEPRLKKRRDEYDAHPSKSHSKQHQDVWDDPEDVMEKGKKLLNAVKSATEGKEPGARLIATDFLRLPNKRQYPSYYDVIKHPICLEEIEAKIENSSYPNLDTIRAEIERVFWNAKKFNMTGSPIFQDAKYLHKLAKQTFVALTSPNPPPTVSTELEHEEDQEDEDDINDKQPIASTSSKPKRGLPVHLKPLASPSIHKQKRTLPDAEAELEGPGGKKPKKVNVWKLLKNRLEKVIAKKDKTGRTLAAEFMDLPKKAMYPDYYETIKRPRAFNTVFTKLKRSEYDLVDDFLEDVGYIFSNALEFNLDDSQIALDAVELKTYFHSLVDPVIAEHSSSSLGPISNNLPAGNSTDEASTQVPKIIVKRKPEEIESTASSGSLIPPIKLIVNRKPKDEPPQSTPSQPISSSSPSTSASASASGLKRPKDSQSMDHTTVYEPVPIDPPGKIRSAHPNPSVSSVPNTHSSPSSNPNLDPGQIESGKKTKPSFKKAGSLNPPPPITTTTTTSSSKTDVAPPSYHGQDRPGLSTHSSSSSSSSLGAGSIPTYPSAASAPTVAATSNKTIQDGMSNMDSRPASPLSLPSYPSHHPRPSSQFHPSPQSQLPPQLQPQPQSQPQPQLQSQSQYQSQPQPFGQKAKQRSRILRPILSAFELRPVQTKESRPMRLSNGRGIRSHSVAFLENVVGLDLDLVLSPGPGPGPGPRSNGNGQVEPSERTDGETKEVTTRKTYALQVLINAVALNPVPPPPPPPPTTTDPSSQRVSSPTMTTIPPDETGYSPRPNLAYRLSLPAQSDARKKLAGLGNWTVEVSVRWKDVELGTGAVKASGKEGYELFIRRI